MKLIRDTERELSNLEDHAVEYGLQNRPITACVLTKRYNDSYYYNYYYYYYCNYYNIK